jgi:hypothetical protein
VVFPGGDQRGKRLRKKERGDLIDCQVAILNRVQERRVGSTAGAERFHGQRMAAVLPQVKEKQPG